MSDACWLCQHLFHRFPCVEVKLHKQLVLFVKLRLSSNFCPHLCFALFLILLQRVKVHPIFLFSILIVIVQRCKSKDTSSMKWLWSFFSFSGPQSLFFQTPHGRDYEQSKWPFQTQVWGVLFSLIIIITHQTMSVTSYTGLCGITHWTVSV